MYVCVCIYIKCQIDQKMWVAHTSCQFSAMQIGRAINVLVRLLLRPEMSKWPHSQRLFYHLAILTLPPPYIPLVDSWVRQSIAPSSCGYLQIGKPLDLPQGGIVQVWGVSVWVANKVCYITYTARVMKRINGDEWSCSIFLSAIGIYYIIQLMIFIRNSLISALCLDVELVWCTAYGVPLCKAYTCTPRTAVSCLSVVHCQVYTLKCPLTGVPSDASIRFT